MSTLSRRQFLRRGSGVLLAAGVLVVPGWARWLGEQMERLQPKKRSFVFDSGVRYRPEDPAVQGHPWHDLITRARRNRQVALDCETQETGRALQVPKKRWRIVSGVHDEIVIEADDTEATREAINYIQDAMLKGYAQEKHAWGLHPYQEQALAVLAANQAFLKI